MTQKPPDVLAVSTERPFEYSNKYVVEFRRININSSAYFVPVYALHRPACREFIDGKLYEPQTHTLVHQILSRRSGDMIHAGAFFGDMLATFSRACAGVVYAFEPVLENYILAKLCVEDNKLGNVALFNAGLSDRLSVGHVDVGASLHRGGGSEISDRGQMTTLIPIDMLELDNVALIQLDVEGHELQALRGAEHTLRRCRPTVLIEDNNKVCGTFLDSLHYTYCGEIPGLEIWNYRATAS